MCLILKINKLRPMEVKWLVQGHSASEWPTWELNVSVLILFVLLSLANCGRAKVQKEKHRRHIWDRKYRSVCEGKIGHQTWGLLQSCKPHTLVTKFCKKRMTFLWSEISRLMQLVFIFFLQITICIDFIKEITWTQQKMKNSIDYFYCYRSPL